MHINIKEKDLSAQEDPRPIAVGGAFSKFTLLVMTYSARLHMLHKFVGHYSHCASVRPLQQTDACSSFAHLIGTIADTHLPQGQRPLVLL